MPGKYVWVLQMHRTHPEILYTPHPNQIPKLSMQASGGRNPTQYLAMRCAD